MLQAGAHEWMVAGADRGCLLVGDVSGYTEYLQETELEHAQDVLADLSDTVVRHLQPTFRLSNLEGDAALTYALEEEIEASMLLDTIDDTYIAFRRRVRDIRHATTCECNACQLIPQLNLKFVVHHGEFVRRPVVGREELTGTDVILVHRLLKNSVSSRLDLDGYALFTEDCVDALGIDPAALEMHEHRERYQDVGEVPAWVEDLEARWRYEDERRRIFVTLAEAQVEAIERFSAPPQVVWQFMTAPDKRVVWGSDVTSIEEDTGGGRRGIGTTTHCVHGSYAIDEEILDWRPFRYFTMRRRFPGLGWVIATAEFRPIEEDATELRLRMEKLRDLKQRLFFRLFHGRMEEQRRRNFERLRLVVDDHMAGREASIDP